MSIKLMGVEGDTLLGEPGAKTQDFLLINQPMFAFPDVSEYQAVNQILLDNNDDPSKFFAQTQTQPLSPERKKTAGIVQGIAKTQLANPLDAQYFSAAPLLFGKDKVAKFSAKPRDPANPSLTPANPPDNYLRMAMKKSLDFPSGQPAVFDFQVQLRPDGTEDDLKKSYPIEDASAKWEEKPGAPFQSSPSTDRILTTRCRSRNANTLCLRLGMGWPNISRWAASTVFVSRFISLRRNTGRRPGSLRNFQNRGRNGRFKRL